MQASKLTRVRNDGFSNNSAITRPGSSASRSPRVNFVFKSSVMAKMRSISADFKSAIVNRFRMSTLPLESPLVAGLLLEHLAEDVTAVVDLLGRKIQSRQ